MADKEHLAILKQGVDACKRWHRALGDKHPIAALEKRGHGLKRWRPPIPTPPSPLSALCPGRLPVRCADCGFLGWGLTTIDQITYVVTARSPQLVEVIRRERDLFMSGHSSGIEDWHSEDDRELHRDELRCLRSPWTVSSSTDARSATISADDARHPHRCRLYIPYERGYTPEQHKELKRDRDMRRSLLLGTLLGAIVGASIGAITTAFTS